MIVRMRGVLPSTVRDEIMHGMSVFGKDNGIQVDTFVMFTKNTVGHRVTPLTCLTTLSADTDEMIAEEDLDEEEDLIETQRIYGRERKHSHKCLKRNVLS